MNIKQFFSGLFVSTMFLVSTYAVVSSPINSADSTQSITETIVQLDSNITI